MAKCDHVAWLELREGDAGPHISYGWRFERIIKELQSPTEQYPQLTFFIGRKCKNEALRQFCKGKLRPSSRNQPNTINLHLVPDSVNSHRPQLIADWDCTRPDILPAVNSPKLCHREETIPVNWPRLTSWEPYDLILARLLFQFCDVICIFSEDIGGAEKTSSLLNVWATIGSASGLPDRVRPRLIIVMGGAERSSATQTVLEEDDLIFNICHPDNKSLFFSSFASITISRLPLNEVVSKTRYRQLSDDVANELHKARVERDASRLSFSATHLNALFEDGLRELAVDMFSVFDPLLSARKGNPLNGSFVSHLSAFFKQGVRLHIPYEGLTSYVASAILMDAYPPSMHGFCPRQVFCRIYRKSVYTALRKVYNTASFANTQCQYVEDQLVALFDMMTTTKESSSQVHRYNVSKWKDYWRWMMLDSTCFWCLRQCREYTLPCGHAICDTCTQKYGELFECTDYEFIVNNCICCEEPAYLKVKIKPPTAGARVLSIDGGGTRGVAPLECLAVLQAELPPELPVRSFFDYKIGTSSGGITVLDMEICQHDVKDTFEAFDQLKQYFRHQKSNVGPRRWIGALVHDGMYDVKDLEDIFKCHFRKSRMFSTPPTRISGGKVAVTCSTIKDGTPFLITNYSGETPMGNCGYGCVQIKEPDGPERDGPFVWQAARATSAVPPLFPPVDIPGVGSFQDGGVRARNNNPVCLGLAEVRRIWPMTPMPDVVLSLGTCSASIASSPRASNFRNILVDGFLPRGYRFIDSSYDGEESWRELKNLLSDRTQTNYIRLNAPFPPGRRPGMDSPDTEPLAKWVRRCLKGSPEMRRAKITLLLSSFVFRLEAMPEFQSGLFHCVGSIRCRAPARAVLRVLSGLQSRIDIFKNDINLGLQLSEDDICDRCGRFCRPVQFFVRHLDEIVTLSLNFEGSPKFLSQFPQNMQWFIDRQGLDCSFGLANHGIPFQIQCESCVSRIQGRREDKKVKYIQL